MEQVDASAIRKANMAEPGGYTVHKGFRIYLPEEGEFRRDTTGRYVVHVRMKRERALHARRIEIPDCFAEDLYHAQVLSIEQGIRLIDDKNYPWLKRVRRRMRRA
jgi:hypothetical protein